AFLICLWSAPVMAQTVTATLSGAVTDAKGAVVPEAVVTALNPSTGLRRKTTTGADGAFIIPLLPPANYTVLVERLGFATAKVSDVILNISDVRALQIKLTAGDISAQVTVVADSTLISESPAVGAVVDRQFVGTLPLSGRSLQSLLELTP